MAAPDPPSPVAAELTPHPERHWRTRLFQLYLVLAVLGFGVLLALATQVPYLAVDPTITRAVQAYDAPWFQVLMAWVSWPGFGPQAGVLVIVAGVALYGVHLRWEAACAVLAGLSPALISTALKVLIQRPRPAPTLVRVASALDSFSFPSGHVFFYTVFFGFLLYLAYTLLRPSLWRVLLLLACGLLIGLVGLSRIELGQHWFSDVLAAYLLGSVCLALMVRVYRWGRQRISAGPGAAAATDVMQKG
jgi:undecaprenyl-diphosphatase